MAKAHYFGLALILLACLLYSSDKNIIVEMVVGE